MSNTSKVSQKHPSENDLADYLSRSLSKSRANYVSEHISRCDECLASVVSAYESAGCGKREKKKSISKKIGDIMKKFNPYLALAIISFALSFIMPRYFVQLLVATLLLGVKWVADSKSAKMLVMIYEAWKHGGEKEASRVLQRMGDRTETAGSLFRQERE